MIKESTKERLDKLFQELVPAEGKAENMAGELVRAISRIGYRFYNDGDKVNVDYGKETCNAAARFLAIHGNDSIHDMIRDMMKGIMRDDIYEYMLDKLAEEVVEYVIRHPEMRQQETEDMFDHYDPDEDQDESMYEDEYDGCDIWDDEEDDY